MKSINYQIVYVLLGFILMIQMISCGVKSGSTIPNSSEKEEIPFILPPHKTTTECYSCNEKKPNDLDRFKDAFVDSKLQQYTDEGKSREEFKNLTSFCDDTIFKVCGDAVVLQATDEKSDRVEFRQLKDLSLDTSSILRFQATFENLPNYGDRKGVTLAQIHSDASGVGRPLFRVEYTGTNELHAVLTNTYVKHEGESTTDYLIGFNDGHELYCKLEIVGSGNQIKVFVKNITTGKSKEKIYTVASKWLEKDGDFYFKTGAYLQVPGKSPRATYYSLNYFYN